MADLKLGNILPVGADNVVVQSKYVKGGYVVVETLEELFADPSLENSPNIKGADGQNIIEGSLSYCQEDSKFYQYDGETWVEAQFGSDLPLEKGITDNGIQQLGAQALGKNSVAFGAAVAGTKGYRYKAIDPVNHRIYLTENDVTDGTTIEFIDIVGDIRVDLQEDFTPQYAVGDIFTLKTRSTDFDNITAITAINNNVISFAEGTALDNLTRADIQKTDTYVDRYSFSVPKKPDVGLFCISEYNFAVGTNDVFALGRYSFAAGRGNKAIGDTATVFGRDNTAGYQAFCAGENSIANERNYTLGYNCKNWAGQALVTGNSNIINKDANYSIVAGFGNVANHPGSAVLGRLNSKTMNNDQVILGRGSVAQQDALLIVGNGIMDETTKPVSIVERKNAFTVWNDGRATIGKSPESKMDVATKEYVDNTNASLEKGAGQNSVQQVGGDSFATGAKSFAMFGGTASATQTMALGEDAVSSAQYAVSIGRNAKATSLYSVSIGLGTQTASPTDTRQNREQIVLGRYNEVLDGASSSGATDGAVLMVGIGTGNDASKRKNGLVVWGDGRVTIAKAPVNNMVVVNKGYLPLVRGTANNSLQAPDATASGTRATPFAQATASGTNSLAIGNAGTIASATHAFAMGENAIASAQSAVSLGGATVASGQWSVALGHCTKVEMRDQIAVGRFNEVLPGPTAYADTTNGAIFMVGNGVGETGRSNAFVSWNDGRATIGKAPTQEMDVANKGYVDTSIANLVNSAPETLNTLGELANALEAHEDAYDGLLEIVGNKADKEYVDEAIGAIDIPEAITEWDFIIDSLDNFTTETLATMYGRVLVRGIKNFTEYDPAELINKYSVIVPQSIKVIKFHDCELIVDITAQGNTLIDGFISPVLGNDQGASASTLTKFSQVTNCDNVYLDKCSFVTNCNILQAIDCSYLINNTCSNTLEVMQDMTVVFYRCSIVSNLAISLHDCWHAGNEEWLVEFIECKHLSNIHNMKYTEQASRLDYKDCLYVDGDTCDNYYIESDIGKIQVITTDGTLQTADMYTKAEVDALIAKAIEEALSYRSLSSNQN